MTEIPKHTLDIPRYVSAISTSKEFLEAGKEGTSRPERITKAAGALALREVRGGEYRSREGDVYAVISKIDSFATSQEQLDLLKAQHAPRTDKLPHLEEVIEFNHAVKQMVNNNPALRFREVVGFITNMYRLSHQDKLRLFASDKERMEHLGWIHNAVGVSLNGMRHELGAEQIIGNIEGLEYADTSTADELKGIDYFVTLGGKRRGIDFKASPHRVAEARSYSNHPERIIWTQLTNDDFGDNFRVSPEIARSKAEAMKAELEVATSAVAA